MGYLEPQGCEDFPILGSGRCPGRLDVKGQKRHVMKSSIQGPKPEQSLEVAVAPQDLRFLVTKTIPDSSFGPGSLHIGHLNPLGLSIGSGRSSTPKIQVPGGRL